MYKRQAYLRREAFFSLLRGREPGESSEQNLEESGLFREGYPLMRICILRLSPAVTNLSRFRSALWETAGIRAFTERDCSVYGEFWDNRRLILLLCGTEEAAVSYTHLMSEGSVVILNGPWMSADFAPDSSDKWSNNFEGANVHADLRWV